MITSFNTSPIAAPTKLNGLKVVVVLALIAVAGYFGYKEYKKYQEKKSNG